MSTSLLINNLDRAAYLVTMEDVMSDATMQLVYDVVDDVEHMVVQHHHDADERLLDAVNGLWDAIVITPASQGELRNIIKAKILRIQTALGGDASSWSKRMDMRRRRR